jgi:hypothetical protein
MTVSADRRGALVEAINSVNRLLIHGTPKYA